MGKPGQRRGLVLGDLAASFAEAVPTWRLVWRASPAGTVGLALWSTASALLPLCMAVVAKEIVNAVVAHAAARAVRWVLAEGAVFVCALVAQRGLLLQRSLLGTRLGLHINLLIVEKAVALELRHFEDASFYDKLTRARREAAFRPLSVVTESFQLLQNLLTFLGYGLVLVHYSPWVALALLTTMVPATLSEMRFSSLAFRLRNSLAPEARRLNYIESVLATDAHVKEVKLLGLGGLFLERYRALGDLFYRHDRELGVRRTRWATLLSLIGAGAFYGCFIGIVAAAAAGAITLGNMTLYVAAFRQGQQAFLNLLTALGGMYENNLYMSNLFSYLAMATDEAVPALPPSSRPLPSLPSGRPRLAMTPVPAIELEGVGFRYPGADGWALRHVDLTIERGQTVALVGHNGAGKTTFIKLLTRLHRPTEGRIRLDGRDLADWDGEALRRRFGVIFQDFNRYQLSVRENVALGSVAHLDEEPRIRQALTASGSHEFIEGLPRGLDTLLGKWFEEGVELSGGQWQKIALARAFVRSDADIMILDEPTAALDVEAEHEVFERFRQLAEGRTTLLISHRLSTARLANRILVFEDGAITEDGSHAELVARGRRYAHLFSLQASGYR
jgi:ATP-binding cassette subfamily B protein